MKERIAHRKLVLYEERINMYTLYLHSVRGALKEIIMLK